MVYVVMGVSGCGKSTIAEGLATVLKVPYHDGDDFHPQANIDKMSSGEALNDDDRAPWLELLAVNIQLWNRGDGVVLACSALKDKYRQILSKFGGVTYVYLKGSRELILARMQERQHFMKPEMLDSQFETLEEPTKAIEVDISKSTEEIIGNIMEKIDAN
ncbi:gluconokinase [Lentisphaera profundi]|uniref:Gluconokinase n=1 Tax=Lentisphaera profundi TaxID=1658616 RepID=A0ABY7VN73_9BACT|nr:gluconokinase [Lentisphaera profundi]WDE95535.1 gluconokinase [Lentisphaera profundi]